LGPFVAPEANEIEEGSPRIVPALSAT
jgi:hypothetical protein